MQRSHTIRNWEHLLIPVIRALLPQFQGSVMMAPWDPATRQAVKQLGLLDSVVLSVVPTEGIFSHDPVVGYFILDPTCGEVTDPLILPL